MKVDSMRSIFHLAFNVTDLAIARSFYCDLLGCREGRSTETWLDFDFFGHQLTAHLGRTHEAEKTGSVDGHRVPVPHMGVVLATEEWSRLAALLEGSETNFTIAPSVRFQGTPGEQRTMFFDDPFGNAIEIKSLVVAAGLFA